MLRINTKYGKVGAYLIATAVSLLVIVAHQQAAIVQGPAVRTANQPVLRIPFQTRVRTAVVPIRINDSRILQCILDTVAVFHETCEPSCSDV